jgi:hypothetical protein
MLLLVSIIQYLYVVCCISSANPARYKGKRQFVMPQRLLSWFFLFLATSRTSVVQAQVLSSLQCVLRYKALDFQLTSYDKYDTYFHDDSIMVLAQTGTYTGAENILEYVKFTGANSPYLIEADVLDSRKAFGGYDEATGLCIFDVVLNRRFKPDPTTTNPIQFQGASMAKLFFDFEEQYVKKIYVFFPIPYIHLVFAQALQSHATRNFVCNVMATTCAEYITESQYQKDNCVSLLEALPIAEGNDLYIDGNTSGCRALHAAFAATNPKTHCAHVSLDPDDADPNGKVKCGHSEFLPVSSLFDEKDFEFFNKFAESQCMDPTQGIILEMDGEVTCGSHGVSGFLTGIGSALQQIVDFVSL